MIYLSLDGGLRILVKQYHPPSQHLPCLWELYSQPSKLTITGIGLYHLCFMDLWYLWVVYWIISLPKNGLYILYHTFSITYIYIHNWMSFWQSPSVTGFNPIPCGFTQKTLYFNTTLDSGIFFSSLWDLYTVTGFSCLWDTWWTPQASVLHGILMNFARWLIKFPTYPAIRWDCEGIFMRVNYELYLVGGFNHLEK